LDSIKQLVSHYLAGNPDFISNLTPTPHETDGALAEFASKFSPSKLQAMSDDEILRWIPFNPESNNDTLSYYLEHHKILKSFGGIGGGSAGKMGYYQGNDGQYKNMRDLVTSKEQVLKFRKLDIELLGAMYDFIKKDDFNGLSDYIQNLKNSVTDTESQYRAVLPGLVWVRKYFAVLFPEKFIQIYGTKFCNGLGKLSGLGDIDGKADGYGVWYQKMNQIAAIAPELTINTNVLSNILWRQPMVRGENIKPGNKFNEIVNKYLAYIDNVGVQNHINAEGYKFEDLKIFKENFNTEAQDIVVMIEKSIVADNLSGTGNYYPRKMLLEYAKFDPEKLRDALRSIADVAKSHIERIGVYTTIVDDIHARRDESLGQTNNTYQDARFLSLLLSFIQPKEYAYYKNTDLFNAIKFVDSSTTSIGGDNANKIKVARDFCKQLQVSLENNPKSKPIIDAFSKIYPDISGNLWLAQDVYFGYSRSMVPANKTENVQNYWIFQGNPDTFNIEEYLSNNVGNVIDWSANQLTQQMRVGDIVYFWAAKDGGLCGIGQLVNTVQDRQATDKESEFGNKKVDIKLLKYFSTVDRLKRADLTNDEILSTSKIVKQPQGSNFLLTANESLQIQKLLAVKALVNVWVFSPGKNSELLDDVKVNNRLRIGWDELGDLTNYSSREQIKQALSEKYAEGGESQDNNTSACDDFVNKMQNGDIVILKGGVVSLYGVGHVVGDYQYDEQNSAFKSTRAAVFNNFGNWTYNPNNDPVQVDAAKSLPVKTMTDITPYPEFVERIFNSILTKNAKEGAKPMPAAKLSLNTILYGPPGTGKTYQALNVFATELLSGQAGNGRTAQEVLADQIKELTWWQVAALALYHVGHHVKVAELSQTQLITAYATFVKNRTTSIRPTLWATLQERSDKSSSNTGFRIEDVEYFNKNQQSEWGLTEEGTSYVQEALSDITIDVQAEAGQDWKKFYRTITFHQSYSYEEFVEGIRPVVDPDLQDGDMKFTIKDGIFKEMCAIAKRDAANKYLLIIDEINRGNISKIFGELITLLEPDKRAGAQNEITVQLPYSQESFSVPSNLYVLGTMNTADRSIALLDIALRRRFTFKEIMPDLSLVSADVEGVKLRELLKMINSKIEIMIDRDHQIGHSYLQKITNIDDIYDAWYTRIVPLLQEYFYNDWERLEKIIGKHSGTTGFIDSVSEANIVKLFGNDSEYTDSKVGSIYVYQPPELAAALRSLYEQKADN
jgi:predicted RNA-binding protein with PUA-like domain